MHKISITYKPRTNTVLLSVLNQVLNETVYEEECLLRYGNADCNFEMVVNEMKARCPYRTQP